jgi:hypothetical protein
LQSRKFRLTGRAFGEKWVPMFRSGWPLLIQIEHIPAAPAGRQSTYEYLSTVPGDEAFRPLAEGGCPYLAK